jgi:hypothetical protein
LEGKHICHPGDIDNVNRRLSQLEQELLIVSNELSTKNATAYSTMPRTDTNKHESPSQKCQ